MNMGHLELRIPHSSSCPSVEWTGDAMVMMQQRHIETTAAVAVAPLWSLTILNCEQLLAVLSGSGNWKLFCIDLIQLFDSTCGISAVYVWQVQRATTKPGGQIRTLFVSDILVEWVKGSSCLFTLSLCCFAVCCVSPAEVSLPKDYLAQCMYQLLLPHSRLLGGLTLLALSLLQYSGLKCTCFQFVSVTVQHLCYYPNVTQR